MGNSYGLGGRRGTLLFDDETPDVTFVVSGERIKAHKTILSASNDHFRDMLGGHKKHRFGNEILLNHVPVRGFRELLTYIYTGRLELEELDEDTILETLNVAYLYEFKELQTAVCQYLERIISESNVCRIYTTAYFFQLDRLEKLCYQIIREHPDATLRSESFCCLPASALCRLLERGAFCSKGIEVSEAVRRWYARRPPNDEGSLRIQEMLRPSPSDMEQWIR